MRRLVVLGASLLALALATPALTGTTPAIAAAGVTAGPVPAGFTPLSFSTLNPSDWWVTGSYPCVSGPCETIVRTQNAGKRFTAIGAPPTGTFSSVTFADAQDGYAFGPGLWTTHDAGGSWQQLRLGSGIDSLRVGGGYAYALVSQGGPPKLMRSPVTQDHWRTLRRGGPLMWSMIALGRTLILQAGSRVLISHDAGVHLDRGPQLGAHTYCQFQAAGQTTILWALCQVTGAKGTQSELLRSIDLGEHWTGVVTPSSGSIDALAPASASSALVGTQTPQLTVNAGASWSPAGGLPHAAQWPELGFLTVTTGLALESSDIDQAGDRRLYITTDGGHTYKQLKFAATRTQAIGSK